MSETLSSLPTEPLPPIEEGWSGPTYFVSQDLLRQSLPYGATEYHVSRVNEKLHDIAVSPDSLEQKNAEAEVLIDGKAYGNEIGHPEQQRNSVDTIDDREWMVNVIHEDPETAKIIADKHIVGFHAAPSAVLAGLVEQGGLFSGRALAERGVATPHGQHDASTMGQDSVSFGKLSATEINVANWAGPNRNRSHDEVIKSFQDAIASSQEILAEWKPDRLIHKKTLNVLRNQEQALDAYVNNPRSLSSVLTRSQFPIAVGITREFIDQTELSRKSGTLMTAQGGEWGEFRPAAEEIPIDALPVIAVPAERMIAVRQLLDQFKYKDVAVVPLEPLLRPERIPR